MSLKSDNIPQIGERRIKCFGGSFVVQHIVMQQHGDRVVGPVAGDCDINNPIDNLDCSRLDKSRFIEINHASPPNNDRSGCTVGGSDSTPKIKHLIKPRFIKTFAAFPDRQAA